MIGATGKVGRHVVSALLERGAIVRALVQAISGRTPRVVYLSAESMTCRLPARSRRSSRTRSRASR